MELRWIGNRFLLVHNFEVMVTVTEIQTSFRGCFLELSGDGLEPGTQRGQTLRNENRLALFRGCQASIERFKRGLCLVFVIMSPAGIIAAIASMDALREYRVFGLLHPDSGKLRPD